MTNYQRFSTLNKRFNLECLKCGNKEPSEGVRPCSKCVGSEHTVRIQTKDQSQTFERTFHAK